MAGAANPFVQVVDLGGSATVGGAKASVASSLSLPESASDNHATALLVAGAIGVLYLLWKGRFRFSMTVGGR